MLKRGDHAAFTNLYLARKQWVVRIARCYLGHDHPDVEDACQEIWLRAYRKILSLQGCSWGEAYSWLNQVARTTAENYRQRMLTPADLRLVYLDANGCEKGLSSDEVQRLGKRPSDPVERENARDAARRLPMPYRATVELILHDWCNYEDVAARLSITAAAARQHVLRALPLLRGMLGIRNHSRDKTQRMQRRTSAVRLLEAARRTSMWTSIPSGRPAGADIRSCATFGSFGT